MSWLEHLRKTSIKSGRELTPHQRAAWTAAGEAACEVAGPRCRVERMHRYDGIGPRGWIVTITGVRGMEGRSFDIPFWDGMG